MSSAKSWFLQTGFGATLGPMPNDALLEMIRTGALLRTDQVREGIEGEWRPAFEFPGLFDGGPAPPMRSEVSAPNSMVAAASPVALSPALVPVPAFVPAPASVPARASVPVAVRTPAVAPSPPANASKIILVPPARPEPPPIAAAVEVAASAIAPPAVAEVTSASIENTSPTVSKIEEVAVSVTAPPENDLIANWKSQRIQSQAELGLVSLAAEMTQAEDAEDFAPELPANLLDDTEQPASSTLSNTKTANTKTANTSSASRPTAQRQAFLDQIPGLENGPRQRVETSKQKWDRWRRSLPTWPVAAVLVLALLALWVSWPRSNRGFYDRYVAIWEEWKIRRGDFKDKEGWEHFLEHTKSELDDMVPWLEKRARSTDREKLWLLWIGRDCFRRMLMQPRQVGSPEEIQLQFHLANLRQLYESPGATTPDAEPTASQKADPEQPTGIGTIDPNLLRPTKKTESPAVPAMPTKSEVAPDGVPGKR
ncbi:MAG: hypothetical protein ACKV2Q_03125 [Planctomycetaceae bacterium]